MDHERGCLSDHIRRVLAERILDGRMKPGERLIELKIAAEFGSSQTPVREALRELEALRLIETLPYRGSRVREVDEREMAEAYAVRGALERLAAESAAGALRGDASALRQAAAGIARAAVLRDLDGYARHDLEFHRTLVAAAGNRTLLALWESLAFETRTRITLARPGFDLEAAAAGHARIVDALEAGDGPTAGRLLEEHARSFMAPPAALQGQGGNESTSANEAKGTGTNEAKGTGTNEAEGTGERKGKAAGRSAAGARRKRSEED